MNFRSFRRWLPLVALSLLAVGAWRTADAVDVDDAATEAIYYERALGTPLLSPRRAPETLRAPIIDGNLQPAILALTQGSAHLQTCLIVEVDDRVLADVSSSTPLIPASNQKLLTTFASLELLGAEHRFTTTVLADGSVVDGVLDGNLYLVGGGDPFLSTADWWTQYDDNTAMVNTSLEQLADAVVATGLTSVTGSLLGDESYFDSVRFGPWDQRLIDQKQSGPLSALSVNEGHASWPAEYAGLLNRSQTEDPPTHAAQVFARLLSERGVTVGATGAGVAPGTTVQVAAIESPTVLQLITHVNSWSSNFGAEMLLKHLGLASSGEGSTAAGAVAVLEVMTAHEFDTTGVVILDGSGLADGFDTDGDEILEQDQLTCSLLHSLLDSVDPDSGFAHSLSIAGERGSLLSRFLDSPAAGHVYAKTGTLRDVTALSGYVQSLTEPDTTIVFSYLVNGLFADSSTDVKALQSPFIEELANYPVGPAISELDPLDTVAAPQPETVDVDAENSDAES